MERLTLGIEKVTLANPELGQTAGSPEENIRPVVQLHGGLMMKGS